MPLTYPIPPGSGYCCATMRDQVIDPTLSCDQSVYALTTTASRLQGKPILSDTQTFSVENISLIFSTRNLKNSGFFLF